MFLLVSEVAFCFNPVLGSVNNQFLQVGSPLKHFFDCRDVEASCRVFEQVAARVPYWPEVPPVVELS